MTWNWQKPERNFRWDRARLEAAEKQFLVSGGVFVGTVRHLAKWMAPNSVALIAIRLSAASSITMTGFSGNLDRIFNKFQPFIPRHHKVCKHEIKTVFSQPLKPLPRSTRLDHLKPGTGQILRVRSPGVQFHPQ